MKPLPNHRCPNCGHPVSAKRWFWRAWVWARWRCESCGTLLRFDSRRRLLFSLAIALLLLVTQATAWGFMAVRISPWIWGGPLFAAGILGFIFVARHGDRIALATDVPKVRSHTI